MSCSIASPQANETVNSLNVTVSVSYDTTVVYSLPTPPGTDPPPPPPIPPVPPAPPIPPVPPVTTTTWRVTCEIVGLTPQTQTVAPGGGTPMFLFTVPAAGDYTVKAKLESVSTGGVVTPHGNDQQNPIHVTNNSPGGIIIILPPPPPPPPPTPPPVMAGTDSAKSGALAATKKASATTDCPPCPTPFVLTGTYPSQAADPTTGMVVQIYHILGGYNEVIDYVSVPLLVGSTLASAGGGSIVVGNTFSTVFPPDARTPGRHFRLYLTGVLGKILYSTSGPVPSA
ncbi:MAG: hypothetical protein U0791_04450 [Gemmataceae bacterium]